MVESAQDFNNRRRNARKGVLARFVGGLALCVILSYTTKHCEEANSMEPEQHDKSHIEQIVEQAHCGHDGQLHYQTAVREQDPGFEKGYRSFCLTGDDGCPFYVSDDRGVHDYCNAPRGGR